MRARIYRPARNAMQSGTARSKQWLLEYEPEGGRSLDPLMGWTSSPDTRSQLKLAFESADEAVAYAEKRGIPYDVIAANDRALRIKSYADSLK